MVDICNERNRRGLRTSRRAAFNKNSLRTMLHNEKYIGVYTYQDIRLEGAIPAIVDEITF